MKYLKKAIMFLFFLCPFSCDHPKEKEPEPEIRMGDPIIEDYPDEESEEDLCLLLPDCIDMSIDEGIDSEQ